MFNQFTHLVAAASGWAYPVVFAFAFLDAMLPVVPSETAVITARVVTATGHLSLPLILAAAACGAFTGDNTAYGIGRPSSARPPRPATSAARRVARRSGGRSASSPS